MPAPDPQNLRRQFRLPPEDESFLNGLGRPWEAVTEAGQNWVLLYGESLPAGYNHSATDVAILMAPGYPPGPLDMAYFHPHLLANRNVPRQSEGRVNIDQKAWQQWSRHRTGDNPWLPGEDNLESHYFYMRAWLADEVKR